jgi:ribosomal protein S18 acetylase RimI-like enzyme
MSDGVTLREGRDDEAAALARCFRQMWLDVSIPEDGIEDDWQARVERFVAHGRSELGLRFFFAEHGGAIVGSVCVQRFAGLYPDLLKPGVRRYGYLWGVWVDAAHRSAGLGRALTERGIAALREGGSTHVLLHAAPMGLALYQSLGFTPTNELRLVLV